MDSVVTIAASGETGTVTARAEYHDGRRDAYFIRYKAADGRAVEQWWAEDALEAVESPATEDDD
jgi:hypothetical protein